MTYKSRNIARISGVSILIIAVMGCADDSPPKPEEFGTFTRSANGFPAYGVFDFASDPDGSVWIATDSGLVHFKDDEFQTLSEVTRDLPVGSMRLVNDDVTTLLNQPRGPLWVGTFEGLIRILDDEITMESSEESGLMAYRVTDLDIDTEGRIWVSALFHGVSVFDGENWQTYDGDDLPSTHVMEVATGPDGSVWIGSRGPRYDGSESGLALFRDGEWHHWHSADAPLPDGGISGLDVGADGTVWVGTPNGLVRKREDDWEVFTAESGELPNDAVRAIETGLDVAVWIGTDGGVVWHRDDEWRRFGDNVLARRTDVTAIHVVSPTEVWIGTSYGGARWKR